MKPIVIITIAFVLLIPITVFAQSYTGVLKLDSIPSNFKEGGIITFSGTLTTTDGKSVSDATIYIKDDVDFGRDTVVVTVTTDKSGKFSATWKAISRTSGSYDFYAIYEGGGDVSKSKSVIYTVTVSGSGPANSDLSSYSESSQYSTAKITLDSVVSTANVGQIITFTGKLSDNGKGLAGKTIEIKDEDLADFDDYLVSAITDSNGRFSASWKVHETESADRQNGSVLVELLQPELVGLSKVNSFLNKLELNTVEIFAAYEESNASVSPNTCSLPSSGSSQSYCQNNVIVIKGVDSGIEDEIVSTLLGEIVPGGTVTGNIDLEDELYNAIQDELGITEDMSMQEMLNLLDDPSLAAMYQTTSSIPTKPSTTSSSTSDYDGDGIPDYRDECVYVKENYNGYEDTDGCLDFKPLETIPTPVNPSNTLSDYDNDGIPDYRDECVYVKENYNGYEDTDGCLDFKPLETVPTNDLFSDLYDGPFEIESSAPKVETKIEKKYVQIDFSINALSDDVKVFEGMELKGKLYYISPKGNELGIANERVQIKSYDGFSIMETLSTDYAGNFKWKVSRNYENYDEKTGTSSWDLYLYFETSELYNLHSKAIGTVIVQNPNIIPPSEVTESKTSKVQEEQFCFLFWCW